MDTFTCTRPFFQDEGDKEAFIEGYVGWKRDQFNCQGIFAPTDVMKAIPGNGDTKHHEALGLEVVMSNVFNRLSKTDKKNVAEVCKCWDALFLVGIETSKVHVDYNKQLVTENVRGFITAEKERRVVQRYCVCRKYTTNREKYECHRLLEEANPDVEAFDVWADDKSGSEGYYDSDC